jgi:hypothetical protein
LGKEPDTLDPDEYFDVIAGYSGFFHQFYLPGTPASSNTPASSRHFLYEMDIWLKTGSCRKGKPEQCELGLCKLYVAICHTQIST